MQPLSKAVIEEVITNHAFTKELEVEYSDEWAPAIKTKLLDFLIWSFGKRDKHVSKSSMDSILKRAQANFNSYGIVEQAFIKQSLLAFAMGGIDNVKFNAVVWAMLMSPVRMRNVNVRFIEIEYDYGSYEEYVTAVDRYYARITRR